MRNIRTIPVDDLDEEIDWLIVDSLDDPDKYGWIDSALLWICLWVPDWLLTPPGVHSVQLRIAGYPGVEVHLTLERVYSEAFVSACVLRQGRPVCFPLTDRLIDLYDDDDKLSDIDFAAHEIVNAIANLPKEK